MIKLNKASLQDFQRLTAGMPKNTVMPILSNIKFEQQGNLTLVTKSNLSTIIVAAVKSEVDQDYDPILIDERILFGFLGETKQDDIEITIEPNKITLKAETKVNLPREDFTNFPQTPASNTEHLVINREIVEALNTAKNFVNDSETAGNYRFVHCKGNFISAFNSHFFYVNNRFDNLPTMMLTQEMCNIICAAQNSLKFQDTDNHYFFTTNAIQYIFTKSEGKIPAVESVLERLKQPGKDFTIPKSDMVSFCNIANMVVETAVSSCTMSCDGVFATLKVNDSNYSRDGERNIPINGVFDEFTFNAKIVVQPLKNVPFDTFQAKTNQNCLIIIGKDEYFCFIGMSKN